MQICSRESSMMNFQSFLAAIEIKDEKRGSNLVSHFQNWEFKGIHLTNFLEEKIKCKASNYTKRKYFYFSCNAFYTTNSRDKQCSRKFCV